MWSSDTFIGCGKAVVEQDDGEITGGDRCECGCAGEAPRERGEGDAPGPVQYVTLMTKSVFLPMFVGLINPRAWR